jgi:hypothetical protein
MFAQVNDMDFTAPMVNGVGDTILTEMKAVIRQTL